MLVVFDGNTVKTGIPLEHIQGQLERVKGRSNGVTLEVDGTLNLESVSVLGQQITKVESPFSIKQGVARLVSVQGRFLKGDFLGEDCWVTLDANPALSREALDPRCAASGIRTHGFGPAIVPGATSMPGST